MVLACLGELEVSALRIGNSGVRGDRRRLEEVGAKGLLMKGRREARGLTEKTTRRRLQCNASQDENEWAGKAKVRPRDNWAVRAHEVR